MLNLSSSSARPPPYSVIDQNTEEGCVAKEISQKLISNCKHNGDLDRGKLSRVLDMVISSVTDETGILPSIVAPPANDNPTDPSLWGWEKWEKCISTGKNRFRDINYESQRTIHQLLGIGITDVDPNKSIQKLSAFISSNTYIAWYSTMDEKIPRTLVQITGNNPTKIVSQLTASLDTRVNFKITGLILAAIELGFLPINDINKLYSLAEEPRV